MVENEFYFLFECPLYSELRIQYLDCYFYELPNNFKLWQLFNSTREKQATYLSIFIYKAFIFPTNWVAPLHISIGDFFPILHVVTFINNSMMQNGEKITDRDVERCHPIGRKVRGRKPQIIVKFSSYKTKSKVFSNKTMLKGHGDRTFVTEDLTTQNHQVVKSLLELRKSRKINSFWTSNGKILAKKAPDTSPIQLNFMDNIPSR